MSIFIVLTVVTITVISCFGLGVVTTRADWDAMSHFRVSIMEKQNIAEINITALHEMVKDLEKRLQLEHEARRELETRLIPPQVLGE